MDKIALEERLYEALGQYDGEIYTLPPGDRLCHGDSIMVARVGNGGSDLFIGTRDEWLFVRSAKQARRLAWFILWTWWAKSTWCGVRTWLWYKLLHRKAKRYLKNLKE